MNTPINWDLPVINSYNKPFTLLSLKGPKEGFPVIGYIAESGSDTLEVFSLEGKPFHRYSTKEDLRNSPLRVTGWLLLRKGEPPRLLEDLTDLEMARPTMETWSKQPNFIALKRIDMEVSVGTNDFADMYPTPLEEIVKESNQIGVVLTGVSVDGGLVSVLTKPEQL